MNRCLPLLHSLVVGHAVLNCWVSAGHNIKTPEKDSANLLRVGLLRLDAWGTMRHSTGKAVVEHISMMSLC